jgi:protein-disulfide isomerase
VLPTTERLLTDYRPCVQIVWRNRPAPYHEFAELAARAALEVLEQRGNAAFWHFHDRIFADQERLSRARIDADAEAIEGIDLVAFRAALAGDEHEDVLRRDEAEVNRINPHYGTPLFFINGTVVEGALPYDVFQGEVEDALRELLPR